MEFLPGLFGTGGSAGVGCDRWWRRAEEKLELLEVVPRLKARPRWDIPNPERGGRIPARGATLFILHIFWGKQSGFR